MIRIEGPKATVRPPIAPPPPHPEPGLSEPPVECGIPSVQATGDRPSCTKPPLCLSFNDPVENQHQDENASPHDVPVGTVDMLEHVDAG